MKLTLTPPADPDGRAEGRRWAIWDGLFASFSDNLVIPFQVLFALYLGATKAQVGLLVAVPVLLGNLVQPLGASWTERRDERKRIYLYANLLARLMWIPAGMLPFLLPRGPAAVYLFIALVTLRTVLASAPVPGWTSLMADLTERSGRGAYFAWRNLMVNLAALGASVTAGWLIHGLPTAWGYLVTFLVAFVAGLFAFASFARVPELPATGPPADPPQTRPTTGEDGTSASPVTSSTRIPPPSSGAATHQQGTLRAWLNLLSWHAMGGFLWSSALWSFSVNIAGPLMAVYYQETLHGDEGIWGLAQAATFLVTILSQRYWGRLADRWGSRRTALLSGIGAALVPVPWLLATRPTDAIWANAWSGLAWAGYNLAAFNLLLEMTAQEYRTRSVAVYNMVMGLTAAIGPMLGAMMGQYWGLLPVFALSTVLRLASLVVIAHMVKAERDRPWRWSDLWWAAMGDNPASRWRVWYPSSRRGPGSSA
ncbi:MAG: MFS transporter [Limnochordaceae bacterium]|nr:MFS transporter [Limnochordaceae bacterium]